MAEKIVSLTVGPVEVNCYIVGCDEHKKCAVIDPGDSSHRILAEVEQNGWSVDKIINTHGHADHTGANAKIKDATGAPLYIHKDDVFLLSLKSMRDMADYIGVGHSPEPDTVMNDGDIIEICPCLSFSVIATPGHTPGGVCLLFNGGLITGDSIFRMSIGRTDLEGGNQATLLKSIKTRILTLPNETKLYPGHGEPSQVGFEKANNPFISGAFQ
ncbi:MBL-fold metallo-hydrolase superfamily [hydrothermal vent metagenome]|uniref:MBL-fold metallo-hydrolase superfamily n=1 Tax=hydrothermal vent metagenome TaxID=652676 RepID=A0A3B1BTL7_9ZZZZ